MQEKEQECLTRSTEHQYEFIGFDNGKVYYKCYLCKKLKLEEEEQQ
jgi:hypothetical protein